VKLFMCSDKTNAERWSNPWDVALFALLS